MQKYLKPVSPMNFSPQSFNINGEALHENFQSDNFHNPYAEKRQAVSSNLRQSSHLTSEFPSPQSFYGTSVPEQTSTKRVKYSKREKSETSFGGSIFESQMNVNTSDLPLQHRESFEPNFVGYMSLKIHQLEAGKTPVVVSGRVISLTIPKAFKDKRNGTRNPYFQSIFIKDESDILEVKIWYEHLEATFKYKDIKLDSLLTVKTSDIRSTSPLNSQQYIQNSFKAMIATSSCVAHVSSRDSLSSIEIFTECLNDTARLFRKPVGMVDGKVKGLLKLSEVQARMLEYDGAGWAESTTIRILVCVKQIYPPEVVNLKNGSSSTKMVVLVLDDSTTANAIELTLWGEQCAWVENWKQLDTLLLISNPRISTFRNHLQLGLSFQSYIEIDPDMNETQFLRHVTTTMLQKVQNATSGGSNVHENGRTISGGYEDIDLNQITVCYKIAHLEDRAKTLSSIENIYGLMYVMISEFDIDCPNPFRTILNARCDTCRKTYPSIPSTGVHPSHCPNCKTVPPPSTLIFVTPSAISFGDDTAEFTHTNLKQGVTERLLDMTAEKFGSLSLVERGKLKSKFLFERVKVYFHMSWNERNKGPTITIFHCELTDWAESFKLLGY